MGKDGNGFIYAVRESDRPGECKVVIYKIPILRETEKQIHVDRPYAFGCKAVLNKGEITIHRTRKEAIEAFIAQMRDRRAGFERRIAETDAMIAEALEEIGI
jgi:UDP-N-acetylglucosamine enolpyruvyl transferase